MKKILVAIDFSEASRNAMDYAAALAKSINGSIVLLHAYFFPAPVGDLPGYIPVSFAEVQEENEALLQREIEYLAENQQLQVTGYVRSGTASSVINDVADEIDAGFIVMGMKGAGKTAGIFGSTVTAQIRNSKRPILVIPENVKFVPQKYIVFGADFGKWPSPESYKTLAHLVKHFKADLKIVHVEKTGEMMGADEVAGKIRANLLFDKIEHSFHTVQNDDIEKGLRDFISGTQTDLLVMVAHHHNLFERLFGTSHTKLMAFQVTLPLLVLRD